MKCTGHGYTHIHTHTHVTLEVFEYRLIHDSEPISHNDTAKEKKLHSEV